MFKNHLKTAWRYLLRNSTFSIIKIAGLSIGLTVCMLILLYTKDELSYDRFHDKQAQLYRIVQRMQIGQDDPRKLGVTVPQLGPSFIKEIPEISAYIRTNIAKVTVKQQNDLFTENALVADSNFFTIWSFPLLKGDPGSALNDIHSMVLSEEIAMKYFGGIDVVGKTLQIKINDQFEAFSISAVAKNTPQNSTIRFGMLLPFNYFQQYARQDDDWIGGNVNTFLLLNPRAVAKRVEEKMQKFFDQRTREQIAEIKTKRNISIRISLGLQPIADLHLGAFGQDNGLEAGSSITYSYILSAIAVFILVIACINFINLAIAQSLKRSKEIGIRKVVGSTRGQLIRQFLTESILVSSLSFALAIVLTSWILPFFNDLANKNLSLSYLADYKLYIGYVLLLVMTSFVAGFYPALVLSSFRPVKALTNSQILPGKNYFTKGLVVFQFALAIFLIIRTVVMYTQLNFLYHKNLGYNMQNLIRVELPSGKNGKHSFDNLKHELAANPAIIRMAGRNSGSTTTGIRTSGKDIVIDYNKVDESFFPVMNVPFSKGRNFDAAFTADLSQSAIVNESFVAEAGWKDPIGQKLRFRTENSNTLTVIGVVKDYHFRSLKEKISPQLFTMDSSGNYGQAWIKISPKDISQTISSLDQSYKKVSPFFPFDYQFMDDVAAKNYEGEAKWKQIIVVAATLFIFISCIGLLGLVILSIEQRTREIGIRKVLGASATGIAVLISKDFMLLVGFAFLVAAPAGYYAVDQWLQHFAYRINITWWIFALAGAIVILLALVTLSFRALRTAMANPVKSLRSE